MKNLLYSFSLLLVLGCTKDFEEVNTNQNAPSTVQSELLLRQVLYGYGDKMSYEGFVTGNLLSQHFAMIDFNLFDRHALSSPQEGGNPWDILYTSLRDNETILQQSRTLPSAAVFEGPALVMKAYLAMNLTDLFGDVPYSQAVQGRTSGVVTPTYDMQEDIYLADGGILANLVEAVRVMDAYDSAIPLRGDIVFNGDLAGWTRFANSLRIKALMRISARQDVSAELQALYKEENYIGSSEQDATFAFAAGPPNSFAFATARIGIFNAFIMSNTAEALYGEYDDPRVAVHFRPSANDGNYLGVANGLADVSNLVLDDYARPGRIWRENTGDLEFNYMTSWETNFLLAEAALKGYLTGANAQDLYETGVTQAFGYWNTALPTDYLTAGPAAWNSGSALEQIITQKWFASIGNAYEGWNEWRRTGFPALLPVAASLNNGLYPVRFPYPADEQALNFENYQGAADATDGNSINVPVWWDVN